MSLQNKIIAKITIATTVSKYGNEIYLYIGKIGYSLKKIDEIQATAEDEDTKYFYQCSYCHFIENDSIPFRVGYDFIGTILEENHDTNYINDNYCSNYCISAIGEKQYSSMFNKLAITFHIVAFCECHINQQIYHYFDDNNFSYYLNSKLDQKTTLWERDNNFYCYQCYRFVHNINKFDKKYPIILSLTLNELFRENNYPNDLKNLLLYAYHSV